MKVLNTLFLLFLSSFIWAQDGGYFITHYSTNDSEVNNINFDIAENKFGVITIANRSGVILFDGRSWEKIKTPSTVFSLSIDSDNNLYTGGADGFGLMSSVGNYYSDYNTISDSTIKNIFDTKLVDDKLYGINSESIVIYNTATKQTQVIKSKYSGELQTLLLIGNEVYVNTSIGGLKHVSKGELKAPSIKGLEGKQVDFALKKNEEEIQIIGLSSGELLSLRNGKLEIIGLEDDKYLLESIVIGGEWINDSLIAIATLKGGIVFVDLKENKISQILNYQNGLPDNEIFDITLDKYKGLWVAHNEGFSRISPDIPIRAYNRYPGLEGNLLSVNYYDNKLYVGTSLGLYYLDTIKKFDEKVILEKETYTVNEEKQQEKEKKGLFGFLKRDEKETVTVAKQKTRYVRRTIKEIDAIKYRYKKVEGITGKVFDLLIADDKLFSGGLDGLSIINDSTSTTITDSPIRSFFVSKTYKKIIVNTYDDQFEVFSLENGNYTKLPLLSDFSDWVSYIFEDQQSRIWFCSNNQVYWMNFEGNEVAESEEYTIENPYFYETYGISTHDTVFFINESGQYYLSEEENKIKQSKRVTYDKYLEDSNGKIWLHYNDQWKALGTQISNEWLRTLSIFSDIKKISYDAKQEDFWIVTEDEGLYKLNSKKNTKNTIPVYDLFLKNIKTTNKIIIPTSDLEFDQQDNSLTFEFVQPEYSGFLNIQYQYRIAGLSDQWSEWSESNNLIPIPYLPDGEYQLEIRSKNPVTGISSIEPITFEIVPPYWKQAWFYAVEFLVLGLLLLLIFRLRKLDYKYQILSRVLALTTLVIIIEFIQTIAESEFGSGSPVTGFLIQITVAIIILPVEGIIRRRFLRNENVKISEFIKKKSKK